MNREKLNEQLFDVFLAEALRQIEEEELQKSEKFFEERKTGDYIPSKRFVGESNELTGCMLSNVI